MRISIMQPTYAPWSGFFDLIDYSDEFVFLDNVTFAKQRKNWQKENRILLHNNPRWIRLPTLRSNGEETLIKDVSLEDKPWREQHLELVFEAYKNHPFFREVFTLYEQALSISTEKLSALNINLIVAVCSYLSINCRFHLASELNVCTSTKGARLVDICKATGATEYYSPLGSAGYIKPEEFDDHKIKLNYQSFTPTIYPQRECSKGFISHLSILDMLFNIGKQSYDIIRESRFRPLQHSEINNEF